MMPRHHIRRPAIELEPRSVDLLALRQESRSTSQRFPSLRHVLWTFETIWERTIILIQSEDWICRQEEVVGAIVVVQELLRSLACQQKKPELSNADVVSETIDHSSRSSSQLV